MATTGTLADGTGAVTGVFDVNKFSTSGSQLLATGTWTGTITDAAGNVLGSGTQTITMPVNPLRPTGPDPRRLRPATDRERNTTTTAATTTSVSTVDAAA